MSDLGLISQKFNVTTENLVSFNTTLDYVRQNSEIDHSHISRQKLLDILESLSTFLDGKNSQEMTVDVKSIIEILRQQHGDHWNQFVVQIKQLIQKLISDSKITLTEDDLELLDDIADAIDAECAYLFRRISNRL